MSDKACKRVLVLCTGNSCRSQMVEGLWRAIGGDAWEVFSAGSKPAGFVHALAVTVMGEIGIDISTQRSKHMDEFVGTAFDLIITVCDGARESCPVLPGATSILHWPFEDPAMTQGSSAKTMSVIRRVRDEIKGRI